MRAGHTFAGKMNYYSHSCAQRTAIWRSSSAIEDERLKAQDDKMQVVSGWLARSTVHFEAPPS